MDVATPEAIEVTHETGDRFVMSVRRHEVSVDQPRGLGGEDTAPTPTELFVASLASCVAFYARRYLARHDLPDEGLQVRAAFTLAKNPARVGSVRVELRLPDGVPPERSQALLAVASHCTVHNSLAEPPEIRIELVG